MKVPVISFLKGFKETIGTFFEKPVTIEYPEEFREIPANYRGRIRLYLDLCVGCTTCSTVCPNASCQMEPLDYQAPKNKRAIFPRVDVVQCIYCGLCEETCPTNAIRLEKEFSGSEFEREVWDLDSYRLSKTDAQLDLEEGRAGA